MANISSIHLFGHMLRRGEGDQNLLDECLVRSENDIPRIGKPSVDWLDLTWPGRQDVVSPSSVCIPCTFQIHVTFVDF